MVEDEIRGTSDGLFEPVGEDSSLDAKRAKIRFNRASKDATERAFGSRSRTTTRKRATEERKASATISDTRAEKASVVKGKEPTLPTDEKPEKATSRSRAARSKAYATVEDSKNYAQFLLSAVEVAGVTVAGPSGEMSSFERGVLQAPLQRMIQRTPVHVMEKGGIVIDSGFLIVGFAIYFSRVFKGIKVPTFGKPKPKETQEDTAAPVAAQAHQVVDTIKAGDVDGLAQPIPSIIAATMNSAI